jgi:hypothetical protein
MRRGLYRVRGVDGRPDDVRVDDNGIETPVEERLYRARDYSPRVEELLWQEDYFNKQSAKDSDRSAAEAAEKAARDQARLEFRARFQTP